MDEPVGLIGIGLLGTALARRLIDAGFAVVGFDIAAARREASRQMGGAPAASTAEVARQCRQVLIAVMTMDQVEQVVEEFITGVALGASTGEPARIEALAARAAARGLTFLDTPASGSSGQVAAGDGFGLIGGDAQAVQEADAVLAAIYPRRRYTGPAGSATMTKLAINHILGLNRAALAEGLVFAERLGLDLGDFLETARQSAAYSQIMDIKGDKMVEGDFSPVSKVSQHLKDVHTMLDYAARHKQTLPFLALLAEVLEACERHGDGERDNAITIEEIRRRRAA